LSSGGIGKGDTRSPRGMAREQQLGESLLAIPGVRCSRHRGR